MIVVTVVLNLLWVSPVNPACPQVAILVPEFQDVNILDRRFAMEGEQKCASNYPYSPCVKKLERVGGLGDNNYTIICGGENTVPWSPTEEK